MLSVKQGGNNHYFWVFGMTWPGIEPWVSGVHSNHYADGPLEILDIYTSAVTWDILKLKQTLSIDLSIDTCVCVC